MATLGSLKSNLLKGKVQPTDAVSKATYSTFRKVNLDTTLEKLHRILDTEHFALVVHSQRLCKCPMSGMPTAMVPRGPRQGGGDYLCPELCTQFGRIKLCHRGCQISSKPNTVSLQAFVFNFSLGSYVISVYHLL